jgi:pyrroline-5-carboxylate reductase
MKATVFLGGGRITSTLVAGLRLAKYDQPIVVHDRHPAKLQQLKRTHDVVIETDLHRAVDTAHTLIVAVRPESVRQLLREIGPRHSHGKLTAVSLAAGIPLSKLQDGLGPPVHWARAMPSPVCRSGRGLTALTFSRSLSKAERAEVRSLFGSVGEVLEIPESQFDAFTVTYSSSHGYHALAALIEAAESIGLDRKTARVAAAHALADGIVSWRDSRIPLEDLLQEAATPGGIAAAVMTSLDNAGFARIVAQALRSGVRQARRNARNQ